MEALRELASQIQKNRPLSELEQLEHQLSRAIERQEFERAAQLRTGFETCETAAFAESLVQRKVLRHLSQQPVFPPLLAQNLLPELVRGRVENQIQRGRMG